MTNDEHLERLRKCIAKGKEGIMEWNQWREDNPKIIPYLEKANLAETDLASAYFSEASLPATNLTFADLHRAKLAGINLSAAYLASANLSGANLSGANLTNARLEDADLTGATLCSANLTGARLCYADFTDARVSNLQYLRMHIFPLFPYRRSIMRGKYLGIRVSSCYGNPIFKRDAEDQDFLDMLEWQWKETWRIWLFRAWGLTDYGRSLLSVFAIASVIVLIFAGIFAIPGLTNKPYYHSRFTPFYFSIVTFTTLVYGDIHAASIWGEIAVSTEAILSHLTSGLLIYILANKLARRS